MEQSDGDWSQLNCVNEMDSSVDHHSKHDGSNLSSNDARSEVYENSAMEGDYLGLYDGYDSYEGSEASSDDEAHSIDHPEISTTPLTTDKQTPFRFINGKDGMATCEMCGAVGIKHAFYSKSKRFCSLSCSRSFANLQREGKLPANLPNQAKPPIIGKKLPKYLPGQQAQPPSMIYPRSISNKSGVYKGYDWGPYIMASCVQAVPVTQFKHVPMSDSWDSITVGMKVELCNYDSELPNDVYWIATVMKICGYKALMRYEGFANDSSEDFWINLCTLDVHPVGWCATSGKPLVPPRSIQNKYVDWKDYLVKRLTGARTLPSNFHQKVRDSMKGVRFRKGVQLEVVDKMCVSAMKVATVDEYIGGRLRMRYKDSQDENDDFWCHMKSSLIHPVGWALQVGHKLHATQDYRSKCLTKVAMQKYEEFDASPDMFDKVKECNNSGLKFAVGMKLEAIDPLNLSAICVATVMKVLKNNYLMIGIDGSIAQNGSDWFCYHSSSPCIFPVGFCEVNGMYLTPPRGHKGPFKWYDYLKQTKATAGPVKLFDKEIPKNGFKSGMKLEAVDLMEPRLICVATVTKIVGRLLRIHFDGWENEYDQWVDSESPDIYPVGWCELNSYMLEGPRVRDSAHPASIIVQRKRKGKTQIYRGPRKNKSYGVKKRKTKPNGKPLTPSPTINDLYSKPTGADAAKLTPKRIFTSSSASLPSLVKPTDNYNSSLLSKGSFAWQDTRIKQEVLTPESLPSSSPIKEQVKTYGSSVNPNTETLKLLKQEIAKVSLHIPGASLSSGSPVSTSSPLPIKTHSLLSSLSDSQQNPLPVATSASPSPISVSVSLPVKKPTDDAEKFTLTLTNRLQSTKPEEWTSADVCQFLRINDYSSHSDALGKKNISGKQFLTLTKEQIVSLTGMKVGPSFKLFDLIQQLKLAVFNQNDVFKNTF